MAKAVEFEIKIKGGDGSAIKAITIEASNADEAISKIVESATRAGDSIRKMAEQSLVLDASVRAIQNLTSMVSNLVAPFNSFETAMRSANTMAGKSGDDFDELTDRIKALSKSIPMAREELANGLYQVISNGVPEGNWLEFLEQSSKAAVGGIADLGQTVTVTSTLIKNYGLSWKSAAEIQDKIQTTAKNGVTSFEQLGQALPRVSGSAAQLGVSMDELMAVFATTTGVTGNTAEVSTQLAAVLNALVKPSSEAQKAAMSMGVSFDAASVKAAGGFKNFLTQLDASIQAYASESGQLSQTIYGQLFGSAEALRLLGSLTGEQKDKFSENINAMCDSAGAIEGAYEDMSSTGSAFSTIVNNQVRAFTDWAASIASPIEPLLNLTANIGSSIIGMSQLVKATRTAVVGLRTMDVAAKASAIQQGVITAATYAWSAAQAALNAVMSANPIAIVVLAVAALVAGVIAAYKNCEGFRKVCDQVWSAVKKVASAVWNSLVMAFEKASIVIKKAWKWIKEFFGISDESSAEEMADTLEEQADAAEEVSAANEKAAESSQKVASANSWQKMSYERLGQAIEDQKKKVASLAGVKDAEAKKEANTLKQMEARYKKLGAQYNLSSSSSKNEFDGKKLIANAKSYKELGNNITYYQTALEKTDPAERVEIERLSGLIVQLKKSQDEIKKLQEACSQPASLNTLNDISTAINHQKSLLENATKDEMAAIQQEINRLEQLQTAMEDAAHVDMAVDQIKTYKELDAEIAYYEDRLQRATEEERTQIAIRINELKKLKEQWDETISAIQIPDDIANLDTIDKLGNAISYYQDRMKKASQEEVAGIRDTIRALEEKQDAIRRSADISDISADTSRLDSMSGKQLKMELKLLGLDSVKDQIRELQAMLDDTKNPLSDAERTRVEGLIASWKKYEKQIKKSSVRMDDAWGSVKGIGNSIKSMTSALKGNGNAWDKVTAIVDGVIQLYNGFGSIVQMIGMLTGASKAHAVVKSVEAAAEETEAGTTAAGAVATVAASAATTTALGVETAAWSALAAAKTFAAHAYIPFAGTAIAAGYIAAQQAIVLAASVPKFAKGALAYGPTLGLFGEYAGAANNPEVVAPLDRLTSLISPQGLGGTVRFEIDGRKLVGVLQKEERVRSRM